MKKDLASKILETIPAAMRMLRSEMRAASHFKFSVPQHRILAHIFGGITKASDLAEIQGVSHPAISKLIESLVKRGCVEREFKNGDRRQVHLGLTEKGRKEFLEYRKAALKKINLQINKLSAHHQSELDSGLSALEHLLTMYVLKDGKKEVTHPFVLKDGEVPAHS